MRRSKRVLNVQVLIIVLVAAALSSTLILLGARLTGHITTDAGGQAVSRIVSDNVTQFRSDGFARPRSPSGAVTLDISNTYYVNESMVFDAGLYAYDVAPESAAIVIAADNVTVDCSGATIAGSGRGTGILNDGHVNVVIKDCVVQGFAYGLKAVEHSTDYATSSFIANLVQNVYKINAP